MKRSERGFFLIEALVALLIFALGVLGMVAMGGAAVASQSDARYRTMASVLADEIASTIALNVTRAGPERTVVPGTVDVFQHQAGGGNCAFSGAQSLNANVTTWAAKAHTVGAGLAGLPGADNTRQQIIVDTAGGFNRVSITLCWRAPSDNDFRRHTLVTYIN